MRALLRFDFVINKKSELNSSETTNKKTGEKIYGGENRNFLLYRIVMLCVLVVLYHNDPSFVH